MDLIYDQYGMLYEIIPNAPRSNYDPRKNNGPHANGIIGFVGVELIRLESFLGYQKKGSN
jgi:hypothetical protein